MAVLVVVDVLSFSTAVDVAVSCGVAVLPCTRDDAVDTANEAGAFLAGRRDEGGPSLSPASLAALEPGIRIVLPSPNGARLSLRGKGRPLLAGCLRNVTAVARAARRLAAGGPVGVIAAGERWPDGTLRPAIEDLVGAGAILHVLGLPPSAEARVARDAFCSAALDLPALLADSVSGRELRARGFAQDVAWAAEQDVSIAAPLLRSGTHPYFATDCRAP